MMSEMPKQLSHFLKEKIREGDRPTGSKSRAREVLF